MNSKDFVSRALNFSARWVKPPLAGKTLTKKEGLKEQPGMEGTVP